MKPEYIGDKEIGYVIVGRYNNPFRRCSERILRQEKEQGE